MILRAHMIGDWFVVHDALLGAARLPVLSRPGERISGAEILLLLSSGAAAAAAVGLAKLGLGIPGHSIVLAALPMAFGVSMAPRRLAGSTMTLGALGTASLLTGLGASYGSGSFVSLALLGPMIDLALRRVRTAPRVYAALVLSGVATNLLALASRASTKLLAIDPGRPFDAWWLQAIVTYTLSGAAAGLCGALLWFHFHERRRRSE
jgi:hypothetical protein